MAWWGMCSAGHSIQLAQVQPLVLVMLLCTCCSGSNMRWLQPTPQGKAGCAPTAAELAEALTSRQLFLYCGHGGGEQYISGGRACWAWGTAMHAAHSKYIGSRYLRSFATHCPTPSTLQPPSCAAWSAAQRRCSWAAAAAACGRSAATSRPERSWHTCLLVGILQACR